MLEYNILVQYTNPCHEVRVEWNCDKVVNKGFSLLIRPCSLNYRFSFCQYPFILSIAAKRTILQRDSEQQMIIMARVG